MYVYVFIIIWVMSFVVLDISKEKKLHATREWSIYINTNSKKKEKEKKSAIVFLPLRMETYAHIYIHIVMIKLTLNCIFYCRSAKKECSVSFV